jgi:hypothetical protein
MRTQRLTRLSAGLGAFAIIAAAAMVLTHPSASSPQNVAGGSGDSATGTAYVSPTVPAMSVDPTAMKMGATATAAPPAATLATSVASPTLKATPAAGCVNNGQCP